MEIRVTEQDFERLTTNSTKWGAWAKAQSHRWEHSTEKYDTDPEWTWARAYWVDRWSEVMLCRAFLESVGRPYEIIFDMAGSDYVILTDYPSLVWQRAAEAHPDTEYHVPM